MTINLSDQPTNTKTSFDAEPGANAYNANAGPDAEANAARSGSSGPSSGTTSDPLGREWPVFLPFDQNGRQIWRKRRVIYSSSPILDQLPLLGADLATAHVMHDEDTHDLIIMADDGRPIRLSKSMVRAIAQKTTVFVSLETKKGDPGGLAEVPMSPTTLDAFMTRGAHPELMVFRGVRKAPFIGVDGRVVSKPGYDEPSGIVLTAKEPLSLPEAPTREDAQRELALLLDDTFGDFPVDDLGRAVIAAAIFSIAARQATGPAPFFLFDSHTAGAGKTLAAELCAMIALGEPVIPVSYRRNGDELSKTLLSALLDKSPVIAVDNVSDGWGCPELDAMATARSGRMKARLLGELKAVEVWCKCVVLASGNGIRLQGDQARRVLWCRLDPQTESPETRRGFKHENLYSYVSDNLGKLHRAVLVCWEAFRASGRPRSDKPLLGSFEGWSEQVRDMLLWLGLPDPVASRELSKERDPDREFLSTLLEVLERLDPTHHGLLTSEIAVAAAHRNNSDLAEALKDFRNGNALNTKSLGRKLSQLCGRHIGDRKLASRRRHGQRGWCVERKSDHGQGPTP